MEPEPDETLESPACPMPTLEFADADGWNRLVEQIRAGEPAALEQLYKVVCQGFSKYLVWRLTEASAADRLQEVMVCVLEAIRKDRVQHPQALIAFIQTIVRRRACEEIGERVQARRRLVSFQEALAVSSRRPDPEEQFRQKERQELLQRLLLGLPGRSREIIVRSYLYEQSQEQICQEMELTPTQYRLLKSRSKARLEENSRAMVARSPKKTKARPAMCAA
jgi:RNA polymerase sigma factor (sigma-70 family)